MAIVDPKDSVFANAADAVSDFETIFDEEDSIIEMVEGFDENGESLIGRDPEEEFTTDNSDGKVDMEDSSPSTDFDIEPDAETGKGVIESADDLDAFFGVNEADDGSAEDVDTDAETGKEVHNSLSDGQATGTQTDDTNKKDILEEPVETDKKDFHDGEVQVDNVKEAYLTEEQYDQYIVESARKTDPNIKYRTALGKKINKAAKNYFIGKGIDVKLGGIFIGGENAKFINGSGKTWLACIDVKSSVKTTVYSDGSVGNTITTDSAQKAFAIKSIADEINSNKDGLIKAVSDEIGHEISSVRIEEGRLGVVNLKFTFAEKPKKENKKGNVSEAAEQTDETNKNDILEEIDDKEDKDFHNESVEDLDEFFGVNETQQDVDDAVEGMMSDKEDNSATPVSQTSEAAEQTDETNKNDILEEIDDKEDKDFHNEAAAEQTDETNKKDILEEIDDKEEKDFHNEAAELDELFESLELGVDDDLGIQKDLGIQDNLGAQGDECNELTHGSLCPTCGCNPCKCGGKKEAGEKQTDETNKKNMLEEIDDKEEKDFHNEGAELDALFESLDLEGEDEFDEFNDSEEGIEKEVKEASEEEIDYAEDELIDAADNEEGGADLKLDYKPGEDDVIIDDVISGKEA